MEVQELNESGEYAPVEVQPRSTVGTGGIFQLRQGQQRRIKVALKPVANSGMLPLICESIVSMAVGCPVVRSELQKPLDSYQEDDLNMLKDKWSEALAKRKEYLDRQLKNILDKSGKTEAENEREALLLNQSMFLIVNNPNTCARLVSLRSKHRLTSKHLYVDLSALELPVGRSIQNIFCKIF